MIPWRFTLQLKSQEILPCLFQCYRGAERSGSVSWNDLLLPLLWSTFYIINVTLPNMLGSKGGPKLFRPPSICWPNSSAQTITLLPCHFFLHASAPRAQEVRLWQSVNTLPPLPALGTLRMPHSKVWLLFFFFLNKVLSSQWASENSEPLYLRSLPPSALRGKETGTRR